jgi:Ca-activated chloride channel family protein
VLDADKENPTVKSLKAALILLLSLMTFSASAGTPGSVKLNAELSNSHVLMPSAGEVSVAIDLSAIKDANGTRLPMNIALVIDRSGSMRGEKMVQTLAAATHFVKQLTHKDTLSIVSYSTDVRIDLPASQMNDEVRKDALAAIEGIQPSGSTNLSGGLFRGQDEVERNLRTGQVNRVILMSDGLANRGIADAKALSMQVQKSAQRGISITTMGVGADYNEDLMTAVADHASGNYYFIKEAKQIASVFKIELDKMFSTVAQAATVTLFLEDGVELASVFGYTFTRKGDSITIPLAEMFGGQKRSILAKVKVPVVREGNIVVGSVTLSYDDISTKKKATTKVDLAVRVTKDKTLVENGRNRGVEERVEEVQVAAVMTKAANMLKSGRAADARKLLRKQAISTGARAKRMGGSARLGAQVKQLEALDDAFGAAEAKPSAAPAMVKDAKEKARQQAR